MNWIPQIFRRRRFTAISLKKFACTLKSALSN